MNTIGGTNLFSYCMNNPVMMIDSIGQAPEWWNNCGKKVLGWVAVGALVMASVALIVPVAIGAVAATSFAAAVMVGAGIGILAGVGGSIVAQGGLSNIGDVNPWSVTASGLIGGAIGAASGAVSFVFAQIGQTVGQSIGFTLSNARYIGNGVKIAKVFGLTTSTLMKAGFVAGGIAGGVGGGMAVNYGANRFVADTFGQNYTVNNPNYVRSGLLNFFQWMYPA